jgi:hypothetical protein
MRSIRQYCQFVNGGLATDAAFRPVVCIPPIARVSLSIFC